MKAAAVADARSLSNAHAEELRLLRAALKRAEEAAAAQEQASEAALANAAQLVRDAQARITETEAKARSSRAECVRLQGALEAAHESYEAVVAGTAEERQRLADGHAAEVATIRATHGAEMKAAHAGRIAAEQAIGDVRRRASEREVLLRKQVEAWETQIADKLGDLGGVCSEIANAHIGTGPAIPDESPSTNDSALPGSTAGVPPTNDSAAGVGRTLLVHLAQAQRVRACFEEAVRRIQQHWHARLSQMGETLAARCVTR